MDNFFSKVLLFGEYSIIKGSNGLAIPLKKYFGNLSFNKDKDNKSETSSGLSLKELSLYLSNSSILSRNIDTEKFLTDVENGLYFDSNIPQGYGVGSSGALCASIYAYYGYNVCRNLKTSPDHLRFTQDVMALMESFYHGSSSGIDPLISYVNQSVLIEGRNKLSIVENPVFKGIGNFYLIDTGSARSTSPLVHEFMRMCDDRNFIKKFNALRDSTDNAICSLLARNTDQLIKSISEISRFQYLHMQKMIPVDFRDLWLTGLESRSFFMKLCGAGGGGFLLLYSPSDDKSFLDGYRYQLIDC